MLLNFCIITMAALLLSALFEKMKLPGLVGMLLVGVTLGPNMLDFIHPTIMEVSAELRTFALIVILLRAGLGINRSALNQVGRYALLMSFIPGVLEGIMIMVLSHYLLDFSWLVSGILGFIIAAVSPAVVVPQMLRLKEERLGENKQIPTLILAGASLDDVVAITIYSGFLGLYFGNKGTFVSEAIKVPVGIFIGVLAGGLIGWIMVKIFHYFHMRDTKKMLGILIAAVVFNAGGFNGYVNTLLGIMTIGFIILEKQPKLAGRLAAKLNKVWVLAEMILFMLIGAQVDVALSIKAGGVGLLILAGGLILRSLGVLIALIGSELNRKERLFTVVAYWPKATVQAAIGAVPLSLGVEHGDLILAMAVLAIVVTAPLGAVMIRWTAPKCLEKSLG